VPLRAAARAFLEAFGDFLGIGCSFPTGPRLCRITWRCRDGRVRASERPWPDLGPAAWALRAIGRCAVVVVSRPNPVRFDGVGIPSDAGVERRSQLFVTDGVRASTGPSSLKHSTYRVASCPVTDARPAVQHLVKPAPPNTSLDMRSPVRPRSLTTSVVGVVSGRSLQRAACREQGGAACLRRTVNQCMGGATRRTGACSLTTPLACVSNSKQYLL
jgi:hypothetical protein